MRITVRHFASFRAGRFVEAPRDIDPETQIADIIAELGIRPAEVGMIMLDGRHAEPEQTLHEGAKLALFPLLGGG